MHRPTNQRENMDNAKTITTRDALHPDYVRHYRRKDDHRPVDPLEWEDPPAAGRITLTGKVIEVGNLDGGISPGVTIERGDRQYVTVCGLTKDEARALAPMFGKKITITLGAPAATGWATASASITPEYIAAQRATNESLRALVDSVKGAPGAIVSLLDDQQCTECSAAGVHLCAAAGAADLARTLEAVAVVGPGFLPRWIRADWSKGLKVGDNLFAFIRKTAEKKCNGIMELWEPNVYKCDKCGYESPNRADDKRCTQPGKEASA